MASNKITVTLNQDQVDEIYAHSKKMIEDEVNKLDIKSREEIDTFLDSLIEQIAGGYAIPANKIEEILNFLCGKEEEEIKECSTGGDPDCGCKYCHKMYNDPEHNIS